MGLLEIRRVPDSAEVLPQTDDVLASQAACDLPKSGWSLALPGSGLQLDPEHSQRAAKLRGHSLIFACDFGGDAIMGLLLPILQPADQPVKAGDLLRVQPLQLFRQPLELNLHVPALVGSAGEL